MGLFLSYLDIVMFYFVMVFSCFDVIIIHFYELNILMEFREKCK